MEWDPQAAVTPLGQLPFFIEFLKTANLFAPWVWGVSLTEPWILDVDVTVRPLYEKGTFHFLVIGRFVTKVC